MCAPSHVIPSSLQCDADKKKQWPLVPSLMMTLVLSLLCVGLMSVPAQMRKRLAMNEIVQGHWTMVDLQISPDAFLLAAGDNDGKSKYKVQASFCNVDWDLHKKNPSKVSFFGSLMNESKSCADTMQTFDLHDLVQAVRTHDAAANGSIRSIEPTGVIFHQSRSGSTLASNLLSAFAPEKTRVYSEHKVPAVALQACSALTKEQCDHDLHVQMIRDVFYLMGRSTTLEYVFYKTDSGGLYIDKFTAAFPDAPWVYMFRDSYEIMSSHWKKPEENLSAEEILSCKCARHRKLSPQPPTTLAVLDRANRLRSVFDKKEYHELSLTEYCALQLASISLAVLQEHRRTGHGRFINYRQMPAVLWETILPNDFGIDVQPDMISKMQQLTTVYSKGHQQGRNNEKWNSDTDRKQKSNLISHNITNAVQAYCPDTYEQLEEISQQQQRKLQQEVTEVQNCR